MNKVITFFPKILKRYYYIESQQQTQTCFDTVWLVWAPKKISPNNNISPTFLRSSFSTFSTF